MKKYLFLILIFSFSFLLSLIQPVLAQEASSSSTTTLEEIQKSLQERIKKAIQADSQNESAPVRLRAFVGEVANLSQNSISITTGSTTKIATVDPQTSILKSNSKIKPEAIKIGDGIIAMGYTTDNQTQTSLRIVLFEPTPPKIDRSVLLTKLEEINQKKQTLKLRDNPNQISFTKTKILNPDYLTLKSDKLNDNQLVIAITQTKLSTDTTSLLALLLLNQTSIPPTPTTANRCGDGTCQDVVCQGLNCPQPETPETCPADCTK